ncbi:multidrug resistance protein [Candida albicans P78048]|uniref:Multidrug resistance protein n=1 Tax=Candida albicans P78048 TaxID=1094989 RepID=A0AB34PNR8_CANAX|nr:multidrug resistance protein [Candida albicans P78048]
MSHSPNLSPQISNDIIDADTTSLASTETQQNIQHSQIHPIGHHGREQSEEPQNTTKTTTTTNKIHTTTPLVDPDLGPLRELEQDLSSLESQQEQYLSQKPTSTSIKTNKVPLRERRGLLAQIVLIPEYEDARDYPNKIKYLIVFIIAFASLAGPFGTSVMLPAIDDIVNDLNTNVSTVNVSVGIYLLSLGIFPLWWSSFSERFGRRSVYMVSFTLFVAFSIGTALSPNIAALIVLRVLQGGSSASVQAVGAGTIADLFIPQERGQAMGLYYLGPLAGPFLAPILGGAVSQAWGWRATQWLLMIISACSFVLITFFLPETLRRVDTIQVAKDLMKKSDNNGSQNEKIHDDFAGADNSSVHDIDGNPIPGTELHQVVSNLSRRSSNARSIVTYMEEQENEGPIIDPVMPSISRLTTNRSAYSQRIHQNYVTDELRKTTSNLTQSNHSQYNNNNNNNNNDNDKWSSVKTNCYDLIIRPLHSIILLKHPPVVLVISFSAISFAAIYFFNMAISYEYARSPYNFSSVILGLMYIPNSVTYFMASIIGGKWNDRLLNRYAQKHGELVPESRLSWNIVVAIILYPMACLIFGWTIKYREFWVIPLIGTALFGFASMLVIGATVTYLVDSLPGKGATGVALNNLIRQILAAIATFIVEPLLRAIGAGVLFSIIAGILLVSSLVLLYLKKRGAFFREHYDVMDLYAKL